MEYAYFGYVSESLYILNFFRRYDSVIERIYKKRVACPQCGIAFKELYGEAYQRHTDWHLQDMIHSKNNKYTRSRPWFMTNVGFNILNISYF